MSLELPAPSRHIHIHLTHFLFTHSLTLPLSHSRSVALFHSFGSSAPHAVYLHEHWTHYIYETTILPLNIGDDDDDEGGGGGGSKQALVFTRSFARDYFTFWWPLLYYRRSSSSLFFYFILAESCMHAECVSHREIQNFYYVPFGVPLLLRSVVHSSDRFCSFNLVWFG